MREAWIRLGCRDIGLLQRGRVNHHMKGALGVDAKIKVGHPLLFVALVEKRKIIETFLEGFSRDFTVGRHAGESQE